MSRLHDAFLSQASSCTSLGSPFMGRLMTLFAENLSRQGAVAERALDWPGDVSPYGASVPLRLAGALHALVLSGAAPELAAVYPPNEASDADLWAAVAAALTEHEAEIMRALDNAPQTNEVRRSAALIPAAIWAARQFELPVVLSELGASAGLNLHFDRFGLQAGDTRLGRAESPLLLSPDWRGQPAPRGALQVAARAGIDLNPLDISQEADRLRLLSYLWPDQPERLRLTRAAIDMADTRPDRGDAAAWLEARLAQPIEGHLHIIYHTIAWQYFPEATAARCETAIEAAGAKASATAPLVHIGMEADGGAPGAALWARVWPGTGERQPLGRADFHGRWIDWQAD